MSEKRYSTDELIAQLADAVEEGAPLGGKISIAIAAKLRAADALKDAATLLRNESIQGAGDWMLSFIHRLDKAIADYDEA